MAQCRCGQEIDCEADCRKEYEGGRLYKDMQPPVGYARLQRGIREIGAVQEEYCHHANVGNDAEQIGGAQLRRQQCHSDRANHGEKKRVNLHGAML